MSNNEIIKKAENRLESLIKQDAIKNRFSEVLGKKAPQFISSLISATKTNKALGECEPMSVISSALQAASLDLPIDNSLGFAYIIPYGGVAQFQLGYKAFVQLAMRTGQYKIIHPSVIYDGQVVKNNSFTGEMEFREQKNSNTVIGYLLYFKLLNGFEKFFYMTKDEMQAHGKRYSQMYKSDRGFWKTDFDAMGLKTIIKLGLSKFGILSVDMQKAIKSDEGIIDIETGEVKEFPDNSEPEIKEPKTISPILHQVIEATAEEVKPKDTSRSEHWKMKMTASSSAAELSRIYAEIPENEQSPDLNSHYQTNYRILANKGAKK